MNAYPPEWPAIATAVKTAFGWRCVRCGHPTRPGGLSLPCDGLCRHKPDDKQRTLTVHHLDGDKSNVWRWNLPPLCQVCHLVIQARYHPDQLDFAYLESEAWLKPFVLARRLYHALA